MDPQQSAELRRGMGIVDNTDQGGPRQVTIISSERWDSVSQALGASVDPVLRRANLLVSGVELEGSRGKVLKVEACRVQVNGETRPCERMDEAHPGLRATLEPHWGGGVYAEVLDDGVIRQGDVVTWVDGS